MIRRALLLLGVVLAAFTLVTCSSKSTSPTYGGGGGGGGSDPAFNLSFPATNASASFTFTKAGTWGYHCNPHQSSGMVGTVIVSDVSSVNSDTVAVGRDASYAPALRFKPASVTIKTGGTVTWTNRSAMTSHTVTRP